MTSLSNETPKQALRESHLFSDTKDFSTQVQSDFQVLNHAVLSASLVHHQPQQVLAREMNLVEAAANKHNFDKILLLISHGEAAVKKSNNLGIPVLTGKGVGQALTLFHQTALYCNAETGLAPELVVLAPLGCSIQTTLHAFPYNSPDSVRGVSWICRGDLVPKEEAVASTSILAKNFPGMDLSYYETQRQSEDFLEWLKDRQERVIVGKFEFDAYFFNSFVTMNPLILTPLLPSFNRIVSSTTEWLQSFCYSTLGCESLSFKNGGEMHAVGLNPSTRY